jgi:hypothetical protein
MILISLFGLQPSQAQLPAVQSAPPIERLNASSVASTYGPVKSWVYAAIAPLAAASYVQTTFAALQPWPRMDCARMIAGARDVRSTAIAGVPRTAGFHSAQTREANRPPFRSSWRFSPRSSEQARFHHESARSEPLRGGGLQAAGSTADLGLSPEWQMQVVVRDEHGRSPLSPETTQHNLKRNFQISYWPAARRF